MNKQTVYVPLELNGLNKQKGDIRMEKWHDLHGEWQYVGYSRPRQAVILDDGEVEKYEKMEQEIERLKALIVDAYNCGYENGLFAKDSNLQEQYEAPQSLSDFVKENNI